MRFHKAKEVSLMLRSPLRVAVLIGSDRPGRFAPTVADWVLNHVRSRADIDLDLIDLAETPLPPHHEWQHPAAVQLRGRIGAADAFLVITPEYNHGYPAVLKHAVDLAYHEWFTKPVAFVSYGGVAGGLRAVEQLRQVFAELHAVTIRDTVSFAGPESAFDAAGTPTDPDAEPALEVLLDRLAWWGTALREARAKEVYAA
ncbi:NADPH-dependent FMN reductase [Blastococcus sp. SYSU DS0510]